MNGLSGNEIYCLRREGPVTPEAKETLNAPMEWRKEEEKSAVRVCVAWMD